MNSSNATVSPAVEDVCRAAIFEALARAPRSTPVEPDTLGPSVTILETAASWVGEAAGIGALAARYYRQGVGGTGAHGDHRGIAAARILAATQPLELIAALSLGGRHALAERIREVHAMTTDGTPDEPLIVLAALRELALFFLGQRQLADPEVGIRPDGLLQAEWASATGDVLAMNFMPGGVIQFAAVSAGAGASRRHRVQGELPQEGALNAIRPFAFLMDPGG